MSSKTASILSYTPEKIPGMAGDFFGILKGIGS